MTFVLLLVLSSFGPAYGQSTMPAQCGSTAPIVATPPDLIDLSAPRAEYLKDLTPALRTSRLLRPGAATMDASMFDQLGSLEKSMILYQPLALVPVDQMEGVVCRSFCAKRREYFLIKTLVAKLNGCRYCMGGVVKGLRGATHDEELIRSFLADPKEAKLSRRERAMVEYARALTVSPADLQPVYVDNLREVGLSDQDIFDLAFMTSWFNMLTRMGPGLRYSLNPQRQVWEKQIYDKDFAAPEPQACPGSPEWPLREKTDDK